jgi:hypothetical protein
MVAESRRQKAESRKQKAEGRRQKAEGRRQKAEWATNVTSAVKLLHGHFIFILL